MNEGWGYLSVLCILRLLTDERNEIGEGVVAVLLVLAGRVGTAAVIDAAQILLIARMAVVIGRRR